MVAASAPRTLLTSLLLLACIFQCRLPASATSPSKDSQPYVISTDASLVVLPVTVTDHEHQFVSGLGVSNFRVYEAGHPQLLSLFEPEDVPVTAGLVVDHSGSMNARKTEVIEGAAAFVRVSNSQDQEFVVNFSDEVRLGLPPNVPFTGNFEDLTTALSAPLASGMTALYDAVVVALDHLRNAPNEKKVLILITDGEDNASHHYFAQVLQMAQATNVIIYAVGLFDTYQMRHVQDPYIAEQIELQLDEDRRVLTQLAKGTGGAAYFPRNSDEVIRVCEQIASDIRHQYTLGYSPRDDGRGGYRKIRVKVVGSGPGKLVVRTRTGYFLPAKGH